MPGVVFWGNLFIVFVPPPRRRNHLDWFQLVESRVFDVADVHGRIYLNSGEDGRGESTATMSPKERCQFQDVTHPEQVELLDE